ncbi:unnamed protein product [Urochloa decumbens]|uniref:Uncharacterized protein n=1 Tax=Urochloa decumbens TaxID=240449 RepID=A0ABC9AW64_9POAL
MDLVTGAMGCLAPKLLQLLQDEYKLQKGVRKQVEFLSQELDSIHAALRKVAEVPWDQLDEQVKVWARQVREASYDMEDVLDTFLVRVEDHAPADPSRLKRAMKKMGNLFTKGKARRDIADAIDDIKKQLQEVAERRARYKVDEIVAKPTSKSSTIDPRLVAMYNEVDKLIGIDKSRGELMSLLLPQWNDESNKKMKIVSVVGVGGLGKTTLAKAVYDELKPQFGCWAFVPVGRNPDLKKVFRDILIDLDKETYMASEFTLLDERQLINELHDFLGTKRYFVVIDDVWETQSWEIIKLAFVENNSGSRIITTTRKLEVATNEVYKLQPLSYGNSKKLFYTRIFGGEDKFIDNQPDEVSEKILKKCDGVPLAIITMASLLVGKSREEWCEVNSSIGFSQSGNQQVESTMRILSLSYYDMPSHLRTCLLYLSAFPEEYVIDKVSLIWKWVAEKFVHRKQGIGLFEVGEGYFNDLINRSMIQAVKSEVDGIVYGCRVHDMVLDLLRSLSHEENFVTILYNNVGMVSGSRVRRLAFQGPKDSPQVINHMDIAQVRSVITYRSESVSLPSFKLLRVLFLESMNKNGCYNLQHIGNLVQLRYLGIRHVYIRELPKEIGALKFLETLDLQGTLTIELPSSVGLLTQLICLRAWRIRIPNGILKKLTSLEELQIYPPEDEKSKGQFVKDLGDLGELRVLRTAIFRMGQSMQYNFMQSLRSLNKMQRLTLVGWSRARDEDNTVTWEAAVIPRHLRHLILENIHLSWLPSCISPSRLPNLCHLDLFVAAMEEQALESLGRLPGLCYLKLSTWSTVTLTDIASNGLFQKLRFWSLVESMVQFVLNEDSSVSFTMWNGVDAIAFGPKMKEEFRVEPAIMPNLEELDFLVPFHSSMHGSGNCNNLGLQQLTSLRKVTVRLMCEGDLPTHEKENEAEAALRHEADVHPNRPSLSVLYSPPLNI